jgi:hypothetical protein
MCFNALISNIDDHPRNHALIAKQARPRDGVRKCGMLRERR